MVCPRCVEAVKQEFDTLDIEIVDIELGRVTIAKKLIEEQKKALESNLAKRGFELLDDKQTKIINEIKSIIIKEIHHKNELALVNFSTLLSEQLYYDYSYLSRLFSSVEGRTIEKFILAQKIEKVKELLAYNELTLSEIAFQMNYSSSAHLSSQFKKITGLSPSAFKKLHVHKRKSLDEI